MKTAYHLAIIALLTSTITTLPQFALAQSPGTSLDDQSEGNLDGVPQTTPGDPSVAAAARLRDAVLRIDPSAELSSNSAQFSVSGVPVFMVYDLNADRMRLMSPAAEVDSLNEEELVRLMQANFESALDARYAIANGVIWSTFIHPLSPLENDEFASGLGQVVNLILTYGETYNSGAIIYGGGDNNEGTGRELIEELEEKSQEI